MKKKLYFLFVLLCFFTFKTTCFASIMFKFDINGSRNFNGCSFTKANSTIEIRARDTLDEHYGLAFGENTTLSVAVKSGLFLSFQFKETVRINKNDIIDYSDTCLGLMGNTENLTYKLILRNSNDVNNDIKTEFGATGSCEDNNSFVECTYVYAPKNVCIDLKTSNVKYTNDNCTDDERTLPLDGNYFKYFIPLNATKATDFSIEIRQRDDTRKLNSDCTSLRDNNIETYTSFLVDSSWSSAKNNPHTFSSNMANGCFLRTVINIPVAQKFYTVSDLGKIKGYNYYFRKINIDNPFPNPIYSFVPSLWYDWYGNNYSSDGRYEYNGKPNIKDSFNNDNILYSIKGDNIKKFDDSFNDKSYLEWDHFNIDGHSNSINSDYFDNIADSDSYSRLGEGD